MDATLTAAKEPARPWVISPELEAAIQVVNDNTGTSAEIKQARGVITDDYFKWDTRRLKVDCFADLMKVEAFCMICCCEAFDFTGRCWEMPCYAFWLNIPLCCLLCCCPWVHCCIIEPHNMSRMSGESFETECRAALCMWCCCYYPCYRSTLRASFRKKYNIVGTPCCDLCQFINFPCCTTMQESYELMAIPEMKYSIPFVNGNLIRAISNVIMPSDNTRA